MSFVVKQVAEIEGWVAHLEVEGRERTEPLLVVVVV